MAIVLGLLLVALPPWVFIVATAVNSDSLVQSSPEAPTDALRVSTFPLTPALNSLALALATCAGCFLLGVPAAFALARAPIGRARWV